MKQGRPRKHDASIIETIKVCFYDGLTHKEIAKKTGLKYYEVQDIIDKIFSEKRTERINKGLPA